MKAEEHIMQSLLTESSDEKDILIIILWQIQNKEDYMIKEAIVKIVNKGDLSYDEAYACLLYTSPSPRDCS